MVNVLKENGNKKYLLQHYTRKYFTGVKCDRARKAAWNSAMRIVVIHILRNDSSFKTLYTLIYSSLQ